MPGVAAPGRWTGGPEELPPPAPPAAEVRDAAREILERPELREPPRSLYQRLQDELAELVTEAFETLANTGPSAFAAWLVLLATLAAAAYLVSRGLGVDRRRHPGGQGANGGRRRQAADWEAEAAAFEDRGEWRPALRCRYRALIARLARTGLLDEAAGRTSGEYRAAVDHAAPLAAVPFSRATEMFEHAWYGNGGTGPAEAEAFRVLAEQALEGVAR